MIQTYGMLELVQHVAEAATRRVTRAAAMSQPSRSTMTERRFARIAFWNGRKVMRMTTNPHPTPEERVEATLNDWRKDAGDLRIHFANAIREAEAIAAWNARPGGDEAVREAEDRGYKRAVKMVAALVADAMIYSDSYGVQGSDFLCCMACNAGGAPGVPFEHSKDCIVLKCETIADDSWQEQRDELNWLNEENDKLRAELTALRTHGSQP